MDRYYSIPYLPSMVLVSKKVYIQVKFEEVKEVENKSNTKYQNTTFGVKDECNIKH